LQAAVRSGTPRLGPWRGCRESVSRRARRVRPQVARRCRRSTDVARPVERVRNHLHHRRMDGELARICAEQRGFFLRWQALASGYTDEAIATKVRGREWTRLRRGAYAVTAHVRTLNASQLNVLVFRAVSARLDGDVVAAGPTALAALGVPVWGVPLDEVHVHRDPGKTSRTEAGVVHHLGDVSRDHVLEVDGLLVAAPARAVVDTARTVPFEAGVVLADGARRLLRPEMDEVMDVLECQRDWAGSIMASRVVKFSDGRAATVGESRGRVMIARLGLPAPDLQRRIEGSRGELIAITDYYFDGLDTAAEFDGRQKYGRELYEQSNRHDEDVDLGDVVWREKRREDAVRDEGHEMVRTVWFELDGHDRAVRQRFLRAFSRAGKRQRLA
jgi:hypothetical protein